MNTDPNTNNSTMVLGKRAEAVLTPTYSYDYDNPAEATAGYSRLHDYIRSARNHVWLIIGIVVVITTLVGFYMARQPDVYEATAHVQVDLEAQNPALGSVKSNAFILNAPSQDPTYFNTQIQILSSAGLLSRVVKTLDLEHNREFFGSGSADSSMWSNVKRTIGFGATDNPQNKAMAERVAVNSLAPQTSRDDMAEMNRLAPYVE